MTSHYIDLRVIPDPETGPDALLGALFDRLHGALVRHKQTSLGVSFPGYSLNPRSLGQVLRLHGTDSALKELMLTDWLKGVRDHVRMSEIALVPETAMHRSVHRRQFKTNVERMRRRRMRRKNETKEQAAAAIPEAIERRPNLPFLRFKSQSTGQTFCLFVALGPTREQAQPGPFNAYGLSDQATVPWF